MLAREAVVRRCWANEAELSHWFTTTNWLPNQHCFNCPLRQTLNIARTGDPIGRQWPRKDLLGRFVTLPSVNCYHQDWERELSCRNWEMFNDHSAIWHISFKMTVYSRHMQTWWHVEWVSKVRSPNWGAQSESQWKCLAQATDFAAEGSQEVALPRANLNKFAHAFPVKIDGIH